MPTKKTITYSQLRVGIVVLIALGIFLFTTLYVTREGGLPLLGGQYTVYSYLGDVNGLKAGAPVHLSGVEVGSVTRVAFAEPDAPRPVKVTIKLRSDIQDRVTTNSQLSVGSLGVLGEKMVDIDPGPAGGEPLPDGGVLQGEAGDPIKGIITDASQTMKDVRDLMSNIQEGRGSLGKILKGEEFHQKLSDFVSRAQEVFQRMNTGEGTFFNDTATTEIYTNLKGLSAGLNDIVTKIKAGEGGLGKLASDPETAASLRNMIQQLDVVSGRMAEGEGSIGALIKEREFYDKLNALSGNLDTITARVENGDGTVGQLLQDRQLYDNLNSTAGELQGLIKDIRADPKRYLRIKVSLF
jgi:phospholipid/cholesterol/gamma-HCH transport system substrate-binding protein